MSLKALTINTPDEAEPHIRAEDDAAIYEGIVGRDCVLNIGNCLSATVISNNIVRISDGVVVVGGHVARVVKGDYEDKTIENGESGKNRNDLIVARFTTTGAGGIDSYTLEVIKGSAGSVASDPSYFTGNLYGGDTQRDLPLYRICIEGLSIVRVEKMHVVSSTFSLLESGLSQINTALSKAQADIIANANSFDYLNKLHSNGEVLNNAHMIDTSTPLSRINTKQWFVHKGGTTGMPPGCTVGMRETFYLNPNWFINRITEIAPIPGRTWTCNYNIASPAWSEWHCNQIGKIVQILDLPSVGGDTQYTCEDFSDANELVFRVTLGGGYITWLTLPNIATAEGNVSLYEGAGQHYRLGLQVINTSNKISTKSHTRGTSWNTSNFGLTVYKKV